MIVDLDEGRSLRRLAGRCGIAIARGDGESGELHRLADGRGDVGGLPVILSSPRSIKVVPGASASGCGGAGGASGAIASAGAAGDGAATGAAGAG